MLRYVSFEARCVNSDGQLVAAELGELEGTIGIGRYRAIRE